MISSPIQSWKILVVDDDINVHKITEFALKNAKIFNLDLKFLNAYTLDTAVELLNNEPDISVALLDIIMDTEVSGLDLVEYIRNELNNEKIRIILRTGQPGKAPEKEIIEKYDINDYKEKTELTDKKLYTALYTAIRAYKDILLNDQRSVFIKRILSSSLSGIYLYDFQEQKVSYVNDQFTKLTGWTLEELQTLKEKEFCGLFHELDVADMPFHIDRLKSGAKENTFELEYKFKKKNGESFWCYSRNTAFNYTHSGEVTSFIGSFLDITSRKNREKELIDLEKEKLHRRRVDSLGVLAGGIAHDFNNILSAIIGFTNLSLKNLKNEEKLVKNLNGILTASGRSKKLISQILNYCRKEQAANRSVDLSKLIHETREFLLASLPSTVEIKIEIDRSLKLVYGDEGKIQEVIMNLVTNSFHAIGKKKGVIILRCYQHFVDILKKGIMGPIKKGYYTVLEVVDNGDGIERSEFDKIFEPFYTTKDIGIGTGMGLSVVYGVVKSHKGNILIESERDVGTSIKIFLPHMEINRFESNVLPDLNVKKGNNEKILFIDDEQLLLDIAEDMLLEYNYCVKTFIRSEDALAEIKKRPLYYDIIVTDFNMPTLNGMALAKEIMKLKLDIPIILCSGFISDFTKEELNKMGISLVVTKPYEEIELIKAIQKILNF